MIPGKNIRPIIRLEHTFEITQTRHINSSNHIFLIWKRAKWNNISCLTNTSILMKPRHAHSSISVYRRLRKWILRICYHSTGIHSWSICRIIRSLVKCEIINVDSWQRGTCRKHEVIGPINVLNKYWVVIINIIWNNISTISFVWLGGPIINSHFYIKSLNIIWNSVMFPTKTIYLIVVGNEQTNELIQIFWTVSNYIWVIRTWISGYLKLVG